MAQLAVHQCVGIVQLDRYTGGREQLGAMVWAAPLAELPTPWTALGAVCFAIADGMIGIGRLVLQSQALEVPVWWVYATSQVLITAGFFGRATTEFGRAGRD